MKLTTKELVLIPLFTALMVVGAWIKIPNPIVPTVPITFQLFFCLFAGILLGARNGLISQLLYILLGLIGLPVFTNGGGLSYIFQPTFGYILGFALSAFVVGLLVQKKSEISHYRMVFIIVIGLLVTYVVGNGYFYIIFNTYLGKSMSLLQVTIMMVPYMIKDTLLGVVVIVAAVRIMPILKMRFKAQA